MKKSITLVSAACLAFVLKSSPLAAQFTVISTSPDHGSANVPLNEPLSITFSAALDTSRNPSGFGFEPPVVIEIYPDSSEFDNVFIQLSPDQRTVTFFNVQWQTGTRYALLITGAWSQAGEPLARPHAVTFTTAASLPTGSIRGTVTLARTALGKGESLAAVDGTVVAVFQETIFGDAPVAGFAIAGASGTYEIPFVPAGEYFPLAIQDTNLDGMIDPNGGDLIAGYDLDQDKLSDTITLAEGETRSGVDFALQEPLPITARSQAATVQSFATAEAPDAVLTGMFAGGLDLNGESRFWVYVFYSANLDANIGFGATSVICFAGFPSDDEEDDGGPFGDTLRTALPENWMDSDAAIQIAQNNGGSEFLVDNPNAQISAFGLQFDPATFFGDGGNARKAGSSPRFTKPSRLLPWRHYKPAQYPVRILATEQEAPYWLFSYGEFGTSSFLNFFVVAVHMIDGTAVPLTPVLGFASEGIEAATQAATDTIPDAVLVAIGTPPFGPGLSNLQPDGRALVWINVFYSAVLDKFFRVVTTGDRVFSGVEDEDGLTLSTQALPADFVGSETVVLLTEGLGGENFRLQHPTASMQAFLSIGLYPQDPGRLVWMIQYLDFLLPPEQWLTFFVDALTGDLITGVEERATIPPREFGLQPVYPNPIVAGQHLSIPIQLRGVAEVDIRIFNMLGQEVQKLFAGNLAAGAHTIAAPELRRELAAGVYFVRMKVQEGNRIVSTFSRPLLVK